MASKEAKERVEEMDENLSFSSQEGEEYDAASLESDLQPPGMPLGYTMVPENRCRVKYKPTTGSKKSPYSIFLTKTTCRSLYGGTDHSVLHQDETNRVQPGVYEGV